MALICACHAKLFADLSSAYSHHMREYGTSNLFSTISQRTNSPFVIVVSRVTSKILACGKIDLGFRYIEIERQKSSNVLANEGWIPPWISIDVETYTLY